MPKDKNLTKFYKKVIKQAEKGFGKEDFWSALGDTDYNPDDINITTYMKMLKDAQVFSARMVKFLAVFSKGIQVKYAGTDPELGEAMKNYLLKAFTGVNRDLNQGGGIFDVIEQQYHNAGSFGYSVGETSYTEVQDDGYSYPRRINVLPPKTLKDCYKISDHGILEKVIQNRNYTNQVIFEGDLDLFRLVVYVHRRMFSNWYGNSDLRICYKNWFIKDYLIKFWNIMLERYGAPFLLGKVSNRDHISDMDKALDSARTKTNFSIWQSDEVSILESTVAQKDQFLNAIKYHDTQILLSQVTPTLLMGVEESGARALGDTHFKVFLWNIMNEQREAKKTYQLEIMKWIDMNFPDVDVYPEIMFPTIANEDLKALSDAFFKIINVGIIDPAESWIRDMMNLPQPDELNAGSGMYREARFGNAGWVITVDNPYTVGQKQPENTKNVGKNLRTVNEFEHFVKECDDPEQRATAFRNLVENNKGIPRLTSDKNEREHSDATRLVYPVNKQVLERMMDREEKKVKKTYDKFLEKQKKRVLRSPNSFKRGKVETWFKKAARQTEAAITTELRIQLQGFSENTIDFDAEIFDDLLDGTDLDIAIDTKFSRTALKKRIGELADTSFKESVADVAFKAKDVVLDGQAAGLTDKEIAVLVGEVYDTYSRGTLNTVVRTIVNDTVNESRLELYKNNPDFVNGVRYDAILDDRTTDFCDFHDGMQIRLDNPDIEFLRPPNHFNCRSLYIPITILDGPFEETYEVGEVYPDPRFGQTYFDKTYGVLEA